MKDALDIIDEEIGRAHAEVERLIRVVKSHAADLRAEPWGGTHPALHIGAGVDGQIALHTARAVEAGIRGAWSAVARARRSAASVPE